jgi:DNA-binding NarL/FixJ family response regulator
MINVAFFEDHPIVQNSLKLVFSNQTDINLLFFASNKNELYEKVRQYNDLEIIIVDLIANDVSGLEVYEYLTLHYPHIKLISFTTMSSPILVENLLSVGAKGYVNKNQDTEDLLEAIHKVADGEIYLPYDYLFLGTKYQINQHIILSDREVEVMQLIIREFSTLDIAEHLNLSISTVENHRKSIFKKLNVKNVAGMVREAAKLGFIN